LVKKLQNKKLKSTMQIIQGSTGARVSEDIIEKYSDLNGLVKDKNGAEWQTEPQHAKRAL
jgi:hypothetical protein